MTSFGGGCVLGILSQRQKKGDEASQALLGIDGLGSSQLHRLVTSMLVSNLEVAGVPSPKYLMSSRPFRGPQTTYSQASQWRILED